jgi:hypothetical protein
MTVDKKARPHPTLREVGVEEAIAESVGGGCQVGAQRSLQLVEDDQPLCGRRTLQALQPARRVRVEGVRFIGRLPRQGRLTAQEPAGHATVSLLRYPLYKCCGSGRIFYGSGSHFSVNFFRILNRNFTFVFPSCRLLDCIL